MYVFQVDLIPGGNDGGLNAYRKFVSGTARKMGQVILPCLRKFTDPTSGLFMFRRGVIDNVELKPIGWKIMIEVLAMGNYSKVIEIPISSIREQRENPSSQVR